MACFVAEHSGRSPLPFLWPKTCIPAMYFHQPIFLFKAIRMSSKFALILFGRINGWGEMPGSSFRSESIKNFRFCSSFKSLSCPLVIRVQFQGSLFLGVKGPRLLSPEIICRVLCEFWWFWLYRVSMCEWEDVEAAGIHSRNAWALDCARATPGNVSALPLQGCKTTGCFFLRAS